MRPDAGSRNCTSASAEHYRAWDSNRTKGFKASLLKTRELVLRLANVCKRYSFWLDVRWKGRQTWHSWYWTDCGAVTRLRSWSGSGALNAGTHSAVVFRHRTRRRLGRSAASGTRLLYVPEREAMSEKRARQKCTVDLKCTQSNTAKTEKSATDFT